MSTMSSEIFKALSELEQEKKISKSYMLEKLNLALIAAYKKDNATAAENIVVESDDLRGQIAVYVCKTVVEEVVDPQTEVSLEEAREISGKYKLGDTVKYAVKTKDFGRIAAQTAKQVIIQAVREAERNIIADEFAQRENEIVSAVVNKIDPINGNISVTFGTGDNRRDLMLSKNEQISSEHFTEGDHIKIYVAEIKKGVKGPMIVISRTHPGFVKRLFELEVPEIASGVVVVNSVAREAGSRTKIAVSSTDPNVGAVGACIGPKRSRINNILQELNGEKIDIVNYSEDPREFISAALSPATVLNVELSEDGKSCHVTVPAEQLSLAIGKAGQNARLAAKLTGIKIDISAGEPLHSEETAENADNQSEEELKQDNISENVGTEISNSDEEQIIFEEEADNAGSSEEE